MIKIIDININFNIYFQFLENREIRNLMKLKYMYNGNNEILIKNSLLF